MLHDVRATVRALARRPGLSFTVMLTLTLGIGANGAIFSAVDAVLLKPLPYPRIVWCRCTNRTSSDGSPRCWSRRAASRNGSA